MTFMPTAGHKVLQQSWTHEASRFSAHLQCIRWEGSDTHSYPQYKTDFWDVLFDNRALIGKQPLLTRTEKECYTVNQSRCDANHSYTVQIAKWRFVKRDDYLDWVIN